jgi:general secretion pathway protein D
MQLAVRVLALTWTVGWSLCFAAPRVLAQPAPAPKSEGEKEAQRSITMDFQAVDIAALVKFISELTGKNFILDDRVHGKVTIMSPMKMSIDEAYQAFQSALQLKGFTTVRAGSMIKIVPTKDAKSAPLDTVVE